MAPVGSVTATRTRPSRPARPVKDAVLLGAVDLARAAAEEVADTTDLVGEHLGAVTDDERLVTHRFAATAKGYRGWHWAVTVARVPRSRTATVCEVHLLPGDDAVLAPEWVPWSERLQPGDVGPGDVLPLIEDDDRLVPGYAATGDLDADQMAFFELGLGRERVLSPQGRSEAAERWYTGSHGPTAPQAIASSAPCSTCAFLVLMAGSLRTEFGVCANEWSPDDGRVVSMDHGCGAHSQTDVDAPPSEWPDAPKDLDVEIVRLLDREAEQAPADPDVQPVADAEGSQDVAVEPALPAGDSADSADGVASQGDE